MSKQTLDAVAPPAARFNPFPGLRPFKFDESHLFFGRDGQSERLLAKLASTRFLAVVGTSGSGKSSLVHAGLLPALYSGFMPGAGSAWRIAIMRPGNDPLGNLARALNEPAVFGPADDTARALQINFTEATLRRGSLGLVETARHQQMPPTENLLIVADQFEELFRVEQSTQSFASSGTQVGAHAGEQENDRAAFVKLLLEARQRRDEGPNIYVVLTMRSDYLGDCAQFWDLPEAINDGQYLIPRLTRAQIRDAITGPAFVGGAEITPRLVNRLLNDVGDNPDQLPILQHALMRTWDHCQASRQRDGGTAGQTANDHVIDLEDYEAIGGMTNALSLHADEAFYELPDERHRKVAEKVFKALTEKGPDNREIRRPVTLGALCDVVEATEPEIVRVIETFRQEGRSFLMPPVGTTLTTESLIDISHESLMRNWPRLKLWVQSEADSAQLYRRLAETAQLYAAKKAELWGRLDLKPALKWRKNTEPNPFWAKRYAPGFQNALNFLAASKQKRLDDIAQRRTQRREDAARTKRELESAQALAEEQQKRAEEQAKSARKLRRLAGAAILLALLAVAAAWAAFSSYRTAEAQRVSAEEQRKRAQESEGKALLQEGYAITARNEALAAAKDAEEKKRLAEEAKEAEELQKKLVAEQNLLLQGKESELQKSLGDSRSLLYVSNQLLAWNAFDQKNYLRAQDFLDASFPAPGTPAKNDLRSFEWFYLWRQMHNEKQTLKGHADSVLSVSYSPDGRTLASGSDDGTVKLWDVASGAEKVTLKGHALSVWSVSFSPDGRTLASGSLDKTVKLWDVASGAEKVTLKGHADSVLSVSFSPDGRTLASGGDGGGGAENASPSNLWLWRGATDAEVARQCIRCGRKP